MSPELAVVAAEQGGLFTPRQAMAAGFSLAELRRRTRGPEPAWVRVRYGVYALRSAVQALDESGKQLLVDEAALVVCDDGTVLSHSAAARRWGIALYGTDDGLTHVTRLRQHDRRLSRIQAGIKHHCGHLDAAEIVTVRGAAVTDLARTCLDVAAEFGYHPGLVATDAALRLGLRHPDLVARLGTVRHDARAAVRARVVADCDPGAESPLETLGRILLRSMGIADLRTQYEVRLTDGRRAFLDLYSPSLRHGFECDGRTKYRDQIGRNGKLVTGESVLWAEKRREDAIRAIGIGLSRIYWPDPMTDARSRAVARLSAEIRSQAASGTGGRPAG